MAFSGIPLSGFSGFPTPEGIFAMGGPGRAESGRAALTGTLPFAAPAAPQPASALAVTSRGGAAPPGPPATLGDLLGDGLSKRGVPEFLAVLDADVSTPLDIFLGFRG